MDVDRHSHCLSGSRKPPYQRHSWQELRTPNAMEYCIASPSQQCTSRVGYRHIVTTSHTTLSARRPSAKYTKPKATHAARSFSPRTQCNPCQDSQQRTRTPRSHHNFRREVLTAHTGTVSVSITAQVEDTFGQQPPRQRQRTG
jgi:hypothetical protein